MNKSNNIAIIFIAISVSTVFTVGISANISSAAGENPNRLSTSIINKKSSSTDNNNNNDTKIQDMMKTMMQNDSEIMSQMMMPPTNQFASSMNTTNSMPVNITGSSLFSFNPDVPITIPMIDGYYNGTKVFFIHTEVSDKSMADMMTKMINFPTLYVPELAKEGTDVSKLKNLSKIYVFTNGVPGTSPYGGGPFMFQIDVFDSIPGQGNYSNFRVPYLVTWNDNATATELTSEEDIVKAESNGDLTIQKTNNVVNAPILAWIDDNNGKVRVVSRINGVFNSMPDYSASIISADINNYMARLKLNK